jgi:acetoin utilization deacetylase AcuC-like enzyme
MTLLYYDPLFLEHETGWHPENRTRLEHIWRLLESSGLAAGCERPAWTPATNDQLIRVHSRGYLDTLAERIASGGGYLDADTPCGPRSLDAARLAAGAALDAVRRVVAGPDRKALCVVRPPGHHALPERAMGFCLLGNVAIAARAAVEELGLERVLIVDWDVHHGNGTQDVFWRDPRVAFLSIHRWPFYPGTGRADETGGGDALGTKLNIPVEFGTSRSDILDAFRRGLDDLATRFRPQLVMVSAGFDALRDDPVGSLNLEVEDFVALTQEVRAAAHGWSEGKLVSVLEGGYDPEGLSRCVAAHLTELISDER